MQALYNKLKYYTIQDAIAFEEADRQFIALKNLWDHPQSLLTKKGSRANLYLALIVANALICYQLSSTWENYWEEFSEYFSRNSFWENIVLALTEFIKQSKWNKRFVETKIKRLEKLRPFLECFIGKEEYYYENMTELRDSLAEVMNQKNNAKTIVFAVKMFSYGARNVFEKIVYFPNEICVPVDSRLTRIFEKYSPHPNSLLRSNFEDSRAGTPVSVIPSNERGQEQNKINKFYFDLSQKLGIPELHLDAILWNNNDL